MGYLLALLFAVLAIFFGAMWLHEAIFRGFYCDGYDCEPQNDELFFAMAITFIAGAFLSAADERRRGRNDRTPSGNRS